MPGTDLTHLYIPLLMIAESFAYVFVRLGAICEARPHAAPLHMAMWGHGRLDANVGSVIDATIAVPAYTLAMAGLTSLPEDYMLQLRARGPADNPTIDWVKCALALGRGTRA